MSRVVRPYRYLNADGAWPGFSWQGLELGRDGGLRLMTLPRLVGDLPVDLNDLPPAALPAGLAIDPEGTIYLCDSGTAAIDRIDGCFGHMETAACIGGDGADATRFREPSALAISASRGALYVADTGNGRVQVFALDTMALVEVLTGLGRPLSLALDDVGNLYVVDGERRQVDQFTVAGDRVDAFSRAVRESGRAANPRAVACDRDLVYVLDGTTANVCVFRSGKLIAEAETGIPGATMFAVVDGVLYVPDAPRRRLVVLRKDQAGVYRRAGDAAGYEGPAVALSPDGAGGLLMLPAPRRAPLRLALQGGFGHEGWLWSSAITVDDVAHFWNRLHATLTLPPGSHVELFVHTGSRGAPPPAPTSDGRFGAPWRAVGSDVTDCFLGFTGRREEALWLGAHFANDAYATPALSQLRVEFDQTSYLPHLPAIYRESATADQATGAIQQAAGARSVAAPGQGEVAATPGGDDFLLRYVSLFESFFDELERRVNELPGLVDPAASPADALPWLAGFLALPIPETLGVDQQRAAIATAYARYAIRGTLAGLRAALLAEAGVRVQLDEPLQTAGWWALPSPSTSCKPNVAGSWVDGEDSVLGFNTFLAATEPQGAVVGTTAVLDGSQLIAQDEFGTPLFEDAAYRFIVRLYPRDVRCAGKLEEVRAILDREKPAHTLYEIGTIESGIRIGFQARLGVDTLLGAGPLPTRLGETGLVLAGRPSARLGVDSEVGVGTQL